MPVQDTLGRPLRNLRLSVTDRCNLRCDYCMPEADYVWLPRGDLLSFEEIGRLVAAFTRAGVERIRLTGGEPLLRRDLPVLVRILAAQSGIRDLAMTTNAVLLADAAQPLREAGLHRLTVSLDTLRRERFVEMMRRDELDRALAGLEAAARAGFRGTKLNAVIVRGRNDDELLDLLAFGREHGLEVRFIEYMDVGGATHWSPDSVVSRAEMLQRIEGRHGAVEPVASEPSAPADRFRLGDGTTFGIVASTTVPFCANCDRGRVTADGTWFRCLYATEGVDLRAAVRAGGSEEELARRIASGWEERADRGAEERLAEAQRAPLVAAAELRARPHLEMHTRGG